MHSFEVLQSKERNPNLNQKMVFYVILILKKCLQIQNFADIDKNNEKHLELRTKEKS